MKDRILVVRCSGNCRYERGPIEPWDDSKTLYFAYGGAWESITKEDCANCKRKGRFNGVEISKAIVAVEKALKKYSVDTEVVTDREVAEIAINALLELNK
jgi:hypothetical protein